METAPGRWRSYYENIADALAGRAELAVTAESVRQTMVAIEAAPALRRRAAARVPGGSRVKLRPPGNYGKETSFEGPHLRR